MNPTDAVIVTHWEDADLVVMARLRGADAQNILQATLTGIAVYVYDLSDETQVGSAALTVSAVIFNTLQTDARWTEDATGYNFRHTVPAAYFPEGDREYRVEIVFTPVTGGNFPLVLSVSTQNLRSS